MSQDEKICTICLQPGHSASSCPRAKYLPPVVVQLQNGVSVTTTTRRFSGLIVEEYQFVAEGGTKLIVEFFSNGEGGTAKETREAV